MRLHRTKLSRINIRPKKAYTLIELLVVIGILAISVSAILAFLTSSLKGSNQININSEVKQNGEVVMATLERQIRNASYVTDYWNGASHVNNFMLNRQGADPLYVKYFPAAGGLNGYIGTYTGTTAPTLPTDYVPISNTDTSAGIDIQNCSFLITNNAGVPPTVTIAFDVYQGINAANRQDFKSSFHMQSTISLRRLN